MPPHHTGTSRAAHTSCTRTASRRSEEHTSELQSQSNLVCRLLLEKKKRCQYDGQSERSHQRYRNVSTIAIKLLYPPVTRLTHAPTVRSSWSDYCTVI